MTVRILHGDCLEVLPTLAAESVHAVITDPPYHLTSIVKRFGGKDAAPAQYGTDGAFARASKGFMGQTWDGGDIAFRPEVWTQIRRVMKPGAHLVAFGGSRTSHRMACAIEDAGFEIRDTLCWLYGSGFPKSHDIGNGWGTALKPAYEPIILARKHLQGTVAANTLQHGCGGLNIDACRVETTDDPAVRYNGKPARGENLHTYGKASALDVPYRSHTAGRWPANVAHDGSDEVEAAFAAFGNGHADTGTASRFFFSGKATADDRMDSKHPTVKPLALMSWLVKLVTPPGGTVLDPFSGSGTTLLAADRLQFHAIGIEQNAEYVADSERRLHIDKGLFANM